MTFTRAYVFDAEVMVVDVAMHGITTMTVAEDDSAHPDRLRQLGHQSSLRNG